MTPLGPEVLARLIPLLDEALELAPTERIRWLADLERQDAGLASEIRALLARESTLLDERFLEPILPGAPASLLAGSRIGAYTLVRPLGRGGMGSVWLGTRNDGRFEGTVALKLLNLALLDSVGAERFRREGQALARLSHPGVARLIDAGVTPTGVPYLAIEHVDGTRIDAYCDEHKLGVEARIALFQQVLAAVANAHANLIVHRDIKPSNILVTADGSVRLLDFGIAKLLGSGNASAEATELTVAGGLPFTPEYAAPEQVTGGAITTATDVYALGLLLYLLLTGRHPTGADAHTTAEHLRATVDVEPLPMSAAVGHDARLRRAFRGDLDNIVARALDKRPAQRYATVDAFADDLLRWSRHEPVQARRRSLGYRVAKFVRRNRAVAAAAVLAAASLLVATVLTAAQMRVAERERDAARAERDRARYEEQRASASSGFMQALLMTIGPSGPTLTTRDLLDRARAMLETDYRGDRRFVARMLIELSEHYAALFDVSGTTELLQRAATFARATGDLDTAADAHCRLGAMTPDSLATLAQLDSALAGNPFDSLPAAVQVNCLRARARLAASRQRFGESREIALRAITVARASGDTLSTRYAAALHDLQVLLGVEHRVRDALDVTREYVRVLDRLGRSRTILMLRAWKTELLGLYGLGRYVEADSILRRIVELEARMQPGREDAITSTIAASLAVILGDRDSALRVFERAVVDARRTAHVEKLHWALSQAAGVLAERGNAGAAHRRMTEARGLRPDDSLVLARLRAAEGRPADALALHLGRAPVTIPAMRRQRHRLTIMAARWALDAENLPVAESLAQAALADARNLQQQETESGDMGQTLLLLALKRMATGDTAGALPLARRAVAGLERGLGVGHARTLEARALIARLGG